MTPIEEAVGGFADDVDALALFGPSSSEYARFSEAAEATDLEVLVVASEDTVSAAEFIEIPLGVAQFSEHLPASTFKKDGSWRAGP
jgi:hypothetical protein